jgi:hypothetical protein
MKNKLKLITAATAALVYCAPLAAFAASPTPAASPKSSPAAATTTTDTTATTKKPRAIPFHGTISTVDQAAKTFTIAGKEKSRVFKIMDTTVITKAGAPATMTNIVANEHVSGSYFKMDDGSLEAKTVKLGPKTETEKKPSKKKKKADDDAASSAASPSPAPKP